MFTINHNSVCFLYIRWFCFHIQLNFTWFLHHPRIILNILPFLAVFNFFLSLHQELVRDGFVIFAVRKLRVYFQCALIKFIICTFFLYVLYNLQLCKYLYIIYIQKHRCICIFHNHLKLTTCRINVESFCLTKCNIMVGILTLSVRFHLFYMFLDSIFVSYCLQNERFNMHIII